jgi:threonine efflux protein|tara:strand:+ start:806 stop:1414 length:609 start_codon:yes stop_codon:yes gene_type:complete
MFIWSSLAHIIALTSPGPDTAIIIRQVSLYGRRAGVLAALGIGVGIYIHCLLAINGLSLLIISNVFYKFIISVIGSAYIFYLGIKMLIPIPNEKNELSSKNKASSSFINGLITNLFNIKAFIFFVSLFSILVDSINGLYFYIYPLYFAFTSSLWFILLSYLLTNKSFKKFNISSNKLVTKITAILLCLIGLSILIKSFYEYF